jgi:tRNA 2-thiocytidine biosynthesis protein TtcA
MQRLQTKKMLQAWEAETPGRVDSIFRSLQHVSLSHLADTTLYDFKGLVTTPGESE